MIKNSKPISMAESVEYLKEEDSEADIAKFIKKFVSLNPKEAKELRRKIEELNLIKMKDEYVAKIIDIMPENEEDINKIFSDVSLDEDETKKILDTIKEFK